MKTSRQPADAPQLYPLSRGFRTDQQGTGAPPYCIDYVSITPPGEQMLIDFGEQTLSKTKSITLSASCCATAAFYASMHRITSITSEEACKAIYHSFCRLGGRPKELVIDQDAVFVASETYGEVIKTRTFEDFCTEQDLRLWVCNKADPESKGPIENSVGS